MCTVAQQARAICRIVRIYISAIRKVRFSSSNTSMAYKCNGLRILNDVCPLLQDTPRPTRLTKILTFVWQMRNNAKGNEILSLRAIKKILYMSTQGFWKWWKYNSEIDKLLIRLKKRDEPQTVSVNLIFYTIKHHELSSPRQPVKVNSRSNILTI